MGDFAAVRARVQSAADQADIVVAFFHAGAEGADKTHVPDGPETAFGEYRGDSRRFARTAIDAGADLVLGSGPHVLRGVELYKNRLIAYSLGNLAGYKNFGTGGNSSLSALLTVAVTPTGRFFAGRIDSLRLNGSAIPSRGLRPLRRQADALAQPRRLPGQPPDHHLQGSPAAAILNTGRMLSPGAPRRSYIRGPCGSSRRSPSAFSPSASPRPRRLPTPSSCTSPPIRRRSSR